MQTHSDQNHSNLSQNIIDTSDHESNDGTFIFTEKSKRNCFSLEDVDRIYKMKRSECLRIIEEKGLRFNPDIKRPDVPIDLYKAGFICYDYMNTPRERAMTLKRYYQIMNFKVDGDHLSRLVEVCNTIDRKYFKQKMAEQHLENFEEQWERYSEVNDICKSLVAIYKARFKEVEEQVLELQMIAQDIDRYSNYK